MPEPRRGPRVGKDTRAEILRSAREAFSRKGYEGVSLRSVARAAGVDPALVHHYFDGKADLFAQAVVLSQVDIVGQVRAAAAGPARGRGERLVRAFLAIWDDPSNTPRIVALIRAVLGSEELGEAVQRDILGRLLAEVPVGPDPDGAARLALTQILGIALGRYVLRLPGLVTAPADELAPVVGPVIDGYLRRAGQARAGDVDSSHDE